MRILGISGSPRTGGNTDILLHHTLEGARSLGADVEALFVRDKRIAPCTGCRSCSETGECIIHDDAQETFKRLKEVDGVIIASPIFFYGVPSQLKALIDRAQADWSEKYILKKENRIVPHVARRGLFLSVGATRGKRLFDGTILSIKYFLDAIDTVFTGEVLIRGIDRRGEISQFSHYLKSAYESGGKFVEGIEVHVSHP